MPIPRTNQWISDPDQLSELTDPESPISGVGKLRLLGMETAVVTFNLSGLAANMTYFEHYRLSAYVDCTPCPPRYGCDTSTSPATCGISEEQQAADGYSCERCCVCQRKVLPRWFELYDDALQVLVGNNVPGDDPSDEFWPYPDNKHNVW